MHLHDLIPESAEYVRKVFLQYQTEDLVYHNLHHTESIVNLVHEIAKHYSLNENELFILTISAWFHDIGHLFDYAGLHEEKGVCIMREYCTKKEIERSVIISIESCIHSTKLPQNPKNLIEEIMCDADLYHLGTEDFLKTNESVRKELELRYKTNIGDTKWAKSAIEFLQNHQYFTTYCQQRLSEGQAKNIQLLLKLL